ncbi:hypothetical protein F4804DRAFT_303688 [Jackrogersella minutella]|nr:hypothetical protein F4804DRAFT_303688 [Jackrogersella minutella]
MATTHLGQSRLGGPSALGQGKEGTGNLSEAQLELNMKQLNLLHIKCRELRTTIHRMLEDIPNGTNQEVYEGFVKAVDAARTQIKDFGALYNSDESKKVLDQAKKSRDANPNGIKPWRYRDHPDWLDLAR